MKRLHLITSFLLLSFIPTSGQIISQYIETSSGTIPKGIEIWNNSASTLNFSSNNLVIEKGTNGAIPSVDFTISSGSLLPWKVIVIGTSDLQTITESNGSSFYLKAFTFNGDDALVVKYGGIMTDIFGIPGSDPGTAWTGNGVSTANQNISLKDAIITGDADGWTDPSLRFETTSTNNSADGFGIAPIIISGTLFVQPSALSDFSYAFQNGPSISQYFTISGTGIYNNIILTPPIHYEISSDNIHYQNIAITLSAISGTLSQTSVYVRLKDGLEVGKYFNEIIDITSVGASEVKVSCNGRVKYTDELLLPNGWINEFHYDNIGTDVNEFVEIVIENATLFDLGDFSVSLYNGGDGTAYGSQTVNNFNLGFTNNGFTFYTWYPGSIQNGPDGFSINYKDEAIQLLSYEGIFTATDGPATGMVSTDIVASQSSTKTLIDYSLQLIGTGKRYSHFQWIDPSASPGEINTYQHFGEYLPPVPVGYKIILLVFTLIALRLFYIRLKG